VWTCVQWRGVGARVAVHCEFGWLAAKESIQHYNCCFKQQVKCVAYIYSKVKSTVNVAICIAHRREHASNVLPLPVSRRWSPVASHSARQSANTARPRTRADVSRDMSVYCPSFHQVLITACTFQVCQVLIPAWTDGRLRLSRPGCLVPCRGGLPVQRQSPT